MATFVKFNYFKEYLAEKRLNLGSDQLKIALSNTAPNAATSQVLGDITEISYSNVSSRNVTTTSSAQTSGVYRLKCSNLTLTATGTVGPFRYIVLYDDTAASDDLICYWDYGVSITLENGDSLEIAFDLTNGVLSLE